MFRPSLVALPEYVMSLVALKGDVGRGPLILHSVHVLRRWFNFAPSAGRPSFRCGRTLPLQMLAISVVFFDGTAARADEPVIYSSVFFFSVCFFSGLRVQGEVSV